MNDEEFEEVCVHYFDITIGERDKEYPFLTTVDLESIIGQKFGSLFLSFCHSKVPPDSPLAYELGNLLDSLEHEVEREQTLIYGLSESTSPHTSQWEVIEGPPPWIWELIYGYKRPVKDEFG